MPLRKGLPDRAVLAFEAEIVSDHRDKLRIRRLSLDARDGVAEELLQRLHVAAVPRDLDGMKGYRPSGARLAWLFCGPLYSMKVKGFIGLFIGFTASVHCLALMIPKVKGKDKARNPMNTALFFLPASRIIRASLREERSRAGLSQESARLAFMTV